MKKKKTQKTKKQASNTGQSYGNCKDDNKKKSQDDGCLADLESNQF